MKKPLSFSSKVVWKGGLTVLCYFLFAACMQHDESLAPRNENLLTDEVSAENVRMGSMHKRTFTAHLSADNELPTAAGPVISKAQGQAIFKLSEDGTSIHYKILVAGLKNAMVAHIHCGEAGVNGQPFVFLFGPSPAVNVNGILAEGDFTQADLIQRADSPGCVGGLMDMEDVIERMQNGTSYLNVHTTAYPGGEIRGQIK